MSQKDSVSRTVNERLAHCKVLLSEAKNASNKVSERAFASAALIKLEQAVYFYCVELGLLPMGMNKQGGQPVKGRIGLECLLSDEMTSGSDANYEMSSNAKEITSLLAEEKSWLNALICAKVSEYAIIPRKSNAAAKGSIFSTEEERESDPVNTIALIDVALVDMENPAQDSPESQANGNVDTTDLQSWVNTFQSLLERQRANSLEY